MKIILSTDKQLCNSSCYIDTPKTCKITPIIYRRWIRKDLCYSFTTLSKYICNFIADINHGYVVQFRVVKKKINSNFPNVFAQLCSSRQNNVPVFFFLVFKLIFRVGAELLKFGIFKSEMKHFFSSFPS